MCVCVLFVCLFGSVGTFSMKRRFVLDAVGPRKGVMAAAVGPPEGSHGRGKVERTDRQTECVCLCVTSVVCVCVCVLRACVRACVSVCLFVCLFQCGSLPRISGRRP